MAAGEASGSVINFGAPITILPIIYCITIIFLIRRIINKVIPPSILYFLLLPLPSTPFNSLVLL